ncbi:MAG: TetR family transcriptional regulator [Pseudomonadota bacterium]
MPRPRTIPDAQIFAAVIDLIREGGASAVTFKDVQKRAGLAPASLVQRYGSRDGMIDAALGAAFTALEEATQKTITAAPNTRDGARKILFDLSEGHGGPGDLAVLHLDFTRPPLHARISAWRATIEAALAERLGSEHEAARVFTQWQGVLLWSEIPSRTPVRELLAALVSD